VNEAEFAVLVSDDCQNQGLGYELLKRLIEIGRAEKLARLGGQILAENHAMQHICKKLGFKIVTDDDGRGCSAQYTY